VQQEVGQPGELAATVRVLLLPALEPGQQTPPAFLDFRTGQEWRRLPDLGRLGPAARERWGKGAAQPPAQDQQVATVRERRGKGKRGTGGYP
jgi:hypothetical protein